MKRSIYTSKLISSVFATIILLHFMTKTTSPKIIFVPFLLCSISMLGKNIALIFEKNKFVNLFDKLFSLGFFSFWFGFLAVAIYTCFRDKNYSVLLFVIPFLLAGAFFLKRKFLVTDEKNGQNSKVNFGIIVSAGLVIIALLAGVLLVVLGIHRLEGTMIFAGLFFTFGSFTFVMFALMLKGCFDKFSVNVFGIYVGAVFVMIGVGIVAIVYGQTNSLIEMIRRFGLWIIIPVLMVIVGGIQIVKSLRDKNE